MLVVALSEYINAAVRLTQDKQDSHASSEAGQLYAEPRKNGSFCVLLPLGYTEQVVKGAADALTRRGATVKYRRLGWLERTHLTRRFSGVHRDAIHTETKHEWKVYVTPVKAHCVGMPRGGRIRAI